MSNSENLSEFRTFENKQILILAVVLVGFTVFFQLKSVFGLDFFYVYFAGFTIIPAILVLVSALITIKLFKQNHFQAKAFLFFTLGAACWFIAEQIWDAYEYVWEGDPFPSEADIFYIASYPFMTAFLFYSLKPVIKSVSRNVWLFSIGLSFVFLVPAFLAAFEDISGEETFAVSIALSYPIMSSIQLVPAIIGVMLLTKKNVNFSWVLLLVAFIIYAIADTFFLFAEIEGTYYDAHPSNLMFVFTYVLLLFALLNRLKFSNISSNKNYSVFFTENVQFENIGKFGIPLTISIACLVILMSITEQVFVNPDENRALNSLLFAFVAMVGVLVIIVFTINKNLSNLVNLRTKELEKQKDNLENLVEEKTQELLKTERLSAIGELSGRLAHDLRNPLSVIKMSVDLIKQNPADSKLSEPNVTKRLDLIEKSIERISHQVDDVLGYVRNSPLKLTNTLLHELIQDSIAKINVPNDIKINLSKKDILIDCDSIKLDAVFLNLIVNSIQAMPNGGNIEINMDEKDNVVTLEFSDSGEGIPDNDLDKVFEPLFTTKQKGTGLGLASCKNIIEQHQGKISVTNHPTKFTILLPKSLSTELTKTQNK